MCVKGFAVDGFRPNATEVVDDDTLREGERERVHVSHGSEAPVRAGHACVTDAGSPSGPARMSTMFARFCAAVVVVVTVLFL